MVCSDPHELGDDLWYAQNDRTGTVAKVVVQDTRFQKLCKKHKLFKNFFYRRRTPF